MSTKYKNFEFTNSNDFLEISSFFLYVHESLETLDGENTIYATYEFYNAGHINTGACTDLISVKRVSDAGYANSIFFNKGIIETEEGSDIIQSIQTGGNAAIYNQKNSDQEPGIINTGDGNDKVYGSSGNVGIQNEGGAITLGDGDDEVEGEARDEKGSGIYNFWQSTRNYIGLISTGSGDDLITGKGGSSGIYNYGIIHTGLGNDKILGIQTNNVLDHIKDKYSGAGIKNIGGIDRGLYVKNANTIDTGEGNDEIKGVGNVGILNTSLISSGDGKDTILGFGGSIGIWNEVEIDTGSGDDYISGEGAWAGIINNGTINTGDGDDIVDAIKGGFRFEQENFDNPRGRGILNLGNGNDSLLGFGTGEFNGGDGIDIIQLPEGLYEISTNSITKGWEVMRVSGFEKLGGVNGGVFNFTPTRIKVRSDGIAIIDTVTKTNNGNGTPGAITGSGVFREGVTLTAPVVTGDPDGMPTKPNYKYQWFKNNSAISLATGKTYKVPTTGSGNYKVGITYTDAQKYTATVNSRNQFIAKVLTGTAKADTLRGTVGDDLITGLGGADRLTGSAGADTFQYRALSDSRLSAYDRITDFTIGTDIFDAPRAVSSTNIKQLRQVSALTQAGIEKVLGKSNSSLGKQVFGSHRAATFTVGTGRSVRTFLGVNDATPGFDQRFDALVEITGYSGSLANLVII